MVSSIETRLVTEEIEICINENIEKFGFNLEIFDNFNLNNINNLLIILKILIFLDIGLALPVIIYFIINNTLYFLSEPLLYILTGLYRFPNSVINILWDIIIGGFSDLDWTVNMIISYILGVIIVLLIEVINPAIKNYIVGIFVFDLIMIIFDIIFDFNMKYIDIVNTLLNPLDPVLKDHWI
jgi:hypothetical protein